MVDEAWLATVRLAREIGDISSLFPPGITRLYDLPFTIHDAIRSALYFLSFDELPEEERPPKRIWLDNEQMAVWWAEIERLREAKYSGQGDQSAMTKNALMEQINIVGPDGGET